MNMESTETNSYGEAKSKVWYTPVQVPAKIERRDPTTVNELQTVDIKQEYRIHFLRAELQDREIYPEKGDFIYFDNLFYEINNTSEIQMWGGNVAHKHSIVCDVHLSRRTTIQIEKPTI